MRLPLVDKNRFPPGTARHRAVPGGLLGYAGGAVHFFVLEPGKL